ncbi:hypothetical protein CEXT_292911 [Caerostris extrusa]|uniref:Uncharacterized protein n=1 Tax=Caerostris extrusa TaxID=172846 RepID=A0AAV4Y3J3_CAEEX|nr:hypothetical protein CEXT_292911 [Caerostris extrusa]
MNENSLKCTLKCLVLYKKNTEAQKGVQYSGTPGATTIFSGTHKAFLAFCDDYVINEHSVKCTLKCLVLYKNDTEAQKDVQHSGTPGTNGIFWYKESLF